MTDEALADHIYEAAFNPDEWTPVLDELGLASTSAGGCMVVMNGMELLGGRTSAIIREISEQASANPDAGTIRRVGYAYANPAPGFLVSSRFYPKEFLENDAFVHTKRAIGLGDEAFTVIPMPNGETALFSIDRPIANGPFRVEDVARLDQQRPHLARAALVAARLRLEHAQTTVSALEALGIPAAVLAQSGRVRASNALLVGVSDRLMPAAFGGIAIVHASANKLFQEAIALALGSHDGIVRSIPVPAYNEQPALVIHVLPLRRSAYDIFSGADILVATTIVHASQFVPSPSILMGLFDLTPSEVKLASALAAGRSLKAAAQDNGIQFSTARSYLEKIFDKTGTNQQSQLVALLKSAQPVLSIRAPGSPERS
jgi:DNA-binding CsgD family transcriptional regulator